VQEPVQPHCGSPPASSCVHCAAVTVPPEVWQALVIVHAVPLQLHAGSPPASSDVHAFELAACRLQELTCPHEPVKLHPVVAVHVEASANPDPEQTGAEHEPVQLHCWSPPPSPMHVL